MEEVMRLKKISKSFGRNQVLFGVDFNLRAGEIHGIMGENGAGKSTLMNIVYGNLRPDSGEIWIDGQKVTIHEVRDAQKLGICFVQQEIALCQDATVAENIFMSRISQGKGFNLKKMAEEARQLLEPLCHGAIDPYEIVERLAISCQQLVEIAKAVSYNSRIIIMDEPTSSLTDNETEHLFKIIRQLQEKGCAIIYISHKMDEIFEICDEISVLRDGKLVMTKPAAETNMGELITAMVGRSLESRFPPVDNKPGDTILSVQHLSTKYAPYLQDVSFDVREGEIFGLYGLVGAGRTELLETIFGVRTRAAGRVYFKNRLMNFSNAKEAIEHGFAMITEERKANGLFLKCDLTFNTTIANLRQYKSGPALSTPKMVKATNKEIKTMRTKCMGPDDMITSLSGGNQQKVIFGKWLEREPQVFMMDEPTRGIDVGAKYEIYELIIRMAKQGKTIIVVSSEMPEILGITNRIGVMSNGHLSGIVNTKETDQEELLRLSAKYL